jgi:hypothetical protein
MHPLHAYIHSITLLVLGIFPALQVPAQISSTTANYSGTLEYAHDTLLYPGYPRTDPYFVFHAAVHGTAVTGSLKATPPGGTPGFDFSWSKYDPVSGDFEAPFFTQSGVPVSSVSGLEAGCYRVNITSMDLDTVLRAWVFPNDPDVKVEKGNDGKIMPYRYTCDYLILSGQTMPAALTYYDLATGKDTLLPNGMKFEWDSDDPDYNISGASSYLSLCHRQLRSFPFG